MSLLNEGMLVGMIGSFIVSIIGFLKVPRMLLLVEKVFSALISHESYSNGKYLSKSKHLTQFP